jgi:DNA-binding HxlR family transcriptional regulator
LVLLREPGIGKERAMKRTNLEAAQCPVARSLSAIGDWWSLLIVRDALDGPRRFGEFQKGLGISKGILTTRLRRLVSLGILTLEPGDGHSAYQRYILTKKGRGLFLVIVSLRQWGEKHCFEKGEAHSMLIENASGRPVDTLVLRSRDGRALSHADTSVQKWPERRRE